ncbi:hypothetical protein B0H11DRAFT_2040145 [Mycena galericulata]|nr:hypothetical protein B0H11DRAFT_2040145 [Mycena galericulata]
MFSMTLYKCGRTLLHYKASKMPLITLFLRDGVFWFLTIFAVSLAELIVWPRGRQSLAQAMVPLNAVIGTRILLNLKRLAAPCGRIILEVFPRKKTGGKATVKTRTCVLAIR